MAAHCGGFAGVSWCLLGAGAVAAPPRRWSSAPKQQVGAEAGPRTFEAWEAGLKAELLAELRATLKSHQPGGSLSDTEYAELSLQFRDHGSVPLRPDAEKWFKDHADTLVAVHVATAGRVLQYRQVCTQHQPPASCAICMPPASRRRT